MCGIVGIVSQHQVAQTLYDSLLVLQHRGQDSAGIVDDDVLRFSLRPYLYRMAGNRIIDHYRVSGRLQELGDEESYLVSNMPGPDQSVADRDFAYCLERRMRPLRLKLHEAFWLTRDESMSYQQAAQALGVAKETVKDWVKQVLKAIRPCREEYEYDGS